MSARRPDLNGSSVVDSHVHIFRDPDESDSVDFLAPLTLGGNDPIFLSTNTTTPEGGRLARDQRNMLSYQRAVNRLAEFLGVEATHESVSNVRRRQVDSNFKGWVDRLFRDAGIVTSLVDMGYPPDADLDEFQWLVPSEVKGIIRIEKILADVWPTSDSLDGFIAALGERLEALHRDDRFVAWKSIIAYRTGLDVSFPGKDAASRAFERLRGTDDPELFRRIDVDVGLRSQVKQVRDHMFTEMLDMSIEFGVPVQIHTGWGDQDVKLALARPSLLIDVARHARFRFAKIVMLHGAYPYQGEAAFMANAFPNVYLDLSLIFPFLPGRGRSVLADIIALAPSTKLLYASDASGSPEMIWLAAVDAKRALSGLFAEFVEEDVVNEVEAQKMAERILSGNSKEVYGV